MRLDDNARSFVLHHLICRDRRIVTENKLYLKSTSPLSNIGISSWLGWDVQK